VVIRYATEAHLFIRDLAGRSGGAARVDGGSAVFDTVRARCGEAGQMSFAALLEAADRDDGPAAIT